MARAVAGRWPAKEFGLTAMDYTTVSCPTAEAILAGGVRVVIHEGMNEAFLRNVAKAVRKVASHYAHREPVDARRAGDA